MKRSSSLFHGASVFLLAVFAALTTSAAEKVSEVAPIEKVAAQILDVERSNAERESIIAAHAGQAAPLIAAMVKDLEPGMPEEYTRIPWLWRVALAAGKRNDPAELKALLEVSLPKATDPLRDWQAVVIGGGIINGLSQQEIWPGDRIAELLSKETLLKLRWECTRILASRMAEDAKVKNGTRYDALRILGADTWENRSAQLIKYLEKGTNAELQQGAVSALSDMKSKNVPSVLLSNLKNLSDHNRELALDALLRTPSRCSALIDAVESKQVDTAALTEGRLQRLKDLDQKRLLARAEKLAGVEKQEKPEVAKVDTRNGKARPEADSAEEKFYHVGVAKIDITPDYPIRLHGYLARKSESEGIIQHIFAKALAIGSDKAGPAVLISVDSCMVPEHVRTEVLKRLSKAGVTSSRFAICSSHTHSAPKLARAADNIFGMDIPPAEQAHIDRYTTELIDKLEQVALAALKDRKPAQLAWGKTAAGFAANRRTKDGPVDHDLPVLKVSDKNGKVRGLLVNYACHCTTLADQPNQICGDWAGYAQEFLEKEHPGAVALTIIGCGADANPAPRPGVDYAKQHGHEISAKVEELLTRELTPLHGKLHCHTKQIVLPFDKIPSREEFVEKSKLTDATGYHARKQLARLDRGEKLQTELPYLVQVWNFGSDLALVFLPGEVVVDYSLRLKKELDASRLWVTAYANDVPCYIPSSRILKEGGYEGGGAMIYYDRPTRLGPETEERIIAAVHELMPKQFVPDAKTASAPESQGAKSVAEALKTFRTKPNFVVDCVASEPLIVDPVAIDFGTDGKLWVCEMHDYPSGMDGNFEVAGGRIKLLEDTDGDGKFDKGSLFLDGLPFPTGLMQWRKGVLVCAAPDILYAEDTDGDGKADVVKKLFTGFATHNYQARINSLRWGLDNWVYGASGLFGGKIKSELTGKEIDCSGRDIRFNPDTGEIEPVHGISQQGRVRDDWGNWFGCDNSTFLWNFPLPDNYVRRNPHVSSPEPRVYGAKDADPNALHPVSRTLERFNNPNSANRTTSACGVEIYRDVLLGKEFYGNAFTGETVHDLVHRLVLESDGITVTGHRAKDEENSEFFASTDNWSRPVEIRTGRDGALWISDMYRAVIEHPRWIPAETLAKLDVRAGDDKGRIYRVYPKDAKLRPVRDLAKISTVKLVALLDTPNGTERDLIHRELYQRQDKAAVKALKVLAVESKIPAVRAQALCVIDGLNRLETEEVVRALEDGVPEVRRNAIRLCEDFLSGGKANQRDRIANEWWSPAFPLMKEHLINLLDDPDLGVRYQLALTLGEWNDPRAGEALAKLARENLANQWIRAAILSSSLRFPAAILKGVLDTKADVAGRNDMIGQLIATAAGASDTRVLESILLTIAPAQGQSIAPWRLLALASLQEALDRKKTTLRQFVRFKTSDINEAADRIQAAIHDTVEYVRDEKAPIEEREAALRLLGSSEKEEDLKTLIEFATGHGNGRLQKAALASLRRQKNPMLPEMLLADWKNYLVGIRPNLIDLILSREEGVRKLLAAVEQGTVAVGEIPAANRQQLLTHANEMIRTRAAVVFPQNKNRQEVVSKFTDQVTKLNGNAEHGADMFAQLCANCHSFRGQGFSVGPDLMPLADKPADYFLLNILDPNAVIEPRFVQYNIETKDGRSLSGVISAETATSVTVSQAGGTKETVLRSDIQEMKASSLSLMPEGLEQGRGPQDFADLVAYLKSRTATFGSATPAQAAEARKKFEDGSGIGLGRVLQASEKVDYTSWMGNLPFAHCRQTDGNSKLIWESVALPGQIIPEQFYTFRFPAGMGFHSQPAGKFTLKVNGKSTLDFNVSLADALWQSKDGKISLRYQIMETSPEDSDGVLTVSVKGDLLEANRSVNFEVAGSAANSQRWFGIYVLKEQTVR